MCRGSWAHQETCVLVLAVSSCFPGLRALTAPDLFPYLRGRLCLACLTGLCGECMRSAVGTRVRIMTKLKGSS